MSLLVRTGKSPKFHRRIGLAAVSVLSAASYPGCLNREIETAEPRTTSTLVDRITQNRVDKIDLLLAIDNSRSMADKQAILATAVPELVNRLVNPPCLDEEGNVAEQPESPTVRCTAGRRQFDPILDIHVGIISSSLGSAGSNMCPDEEASKVPNGAPVGTPAKPCANGNSNFSQNDKGHLLNRLEPCSPDKATEVYADKGFLAWAPRSTAPEAVHDAAALQGSLQEMVKGVGQIGCGFEAQLESIYRFVGDPAPYESIALVANPGHAEVQSLVGTDQVLLAERRDFLRPDSLLAILMLSDENDCSVRAVNGESNQLIATDGRLWRPRSECAKDPSDRCCTSCGAPAPEGCPEDDSCYTTDPNGKKVPARLEANIDSRNLRCFDQKRRFGVSFLYPVERYVNAFTKPLLNMKRADLAVAPGDEAEAVANPLFVPFAEGKQRDPSLVFVATIAGVPWQDIAVDKENLKKGFKNAEQLKSNLGDGKTTWDVILGDPTNGVLPLDPLMIESVEARSGTNPITLEPLDNDFDPPSANAVNGQEYPISVTWPEGVAREQDDLQYACIFDLPSPIDCSSKSDQCDCNVGQSDFNPLCSLNTDGTMTLQTKAKAYPATRQLQVVKAIDAQGIVASVCPKSLEGGKEAEADYGYNPAIVGIVDRLAKTLQNPCLPRKLTPDDEGQVSCLMLEARKAGSACNCDAASGRSHYSEQEAGAVEAILADRYKEEQNPWDCVCKINQLQGDARKTCQNDEIIDSDQGVNGWCYVDAETGSSALVADCAATERRKVRFVGQGQAMPGATVFISCTGE